MYTHTNIAKSPYPAKFRLIVLNKIVSREIVTIHNYTDIPQQSTTCARPHSASSAATAAHNQSGI